MRHRTTDTPKGHRNYIIIACDVLLFLAMLKWLPVEPEVARGLAVLTFLGILWLTEALHVTVTSLLVPVLAMLMGILPGAKALSGFADPTIFLFFGGFALAGALHEQKIDTWLAGKILLMARGSLGMALILIFLATAFLSMWMSNTATAAMMLPLVIGLLDRIPAENLRRRLLLLFWVWRTAPPSAVWGRWWGLLPMPLRRMNSAWGLRNGSGLPCPLSWCSE